jgi:hypothetical protein
MRFWAGELHMPKICIFGSYHEFQEDSPIDSAYNEHLRELLRSHSVDTVFEEATGLPSKSCVELLADELELRWLNVDLSKEERKKLPDLALSSKYDTQQDIEMHRQRENIWVKNISETDSDSSLLICGVCHVISLGNKLSELGYSVEAHVYSPKRIFNWSNRPRFVSEGPASKAG